MRHALRHASVLRRGTVAVAMLLACAVAFPQLLLAQAPTSSFGGLSESSDEPIDIESDVLVVYDKQKYATFKGNVKAVQGTTTLRAKELNVHYVGGDKLSAGTNKTDAAQAQEAEAKSGESAAKTQRQITKIEAKGEVVITSKDDQTTTSDWALYDLPTQLVTVGGNVVLTQGKNVLKGDRLVIDLKTGESRFENTGDTAAGGRIRALFMPKDSKKGESGEGKDGESKSGGGAKKAASSSDEPDATGATANETPADQPGVPWPLTPNAKP